LHQAGEAILWGVSGLPAHLDRTAAAMWALVDGHTTTADIADDLIAVFGLDRGEAQTIVEGFVLWLEQHRLLVPTEAPSQPTPTPSVVPPDRAAASPVST
jgi:hypothetical protein